MTTVVLVRHGETDWNREGRIQGWRATELNARGREQARAAGRYLAREYDVDRAVVSDLARTRETATLLREGGVDAPASHDRAWRERGFGAYEGLDYEEVFDRHPEHDVTSGVVAVDDSPDGGESLRTFAGRVTDGWERLLAAADPGETVLVVTHGGPIYVVLGRVRGLDVPTAIAEGHQDNCAVSEVRRDPGGGTRVVSENQTPWG